MTRVNEELNPGVFGARLLDEFQNTHGCAAEFFTARVAMPDLEDA